MAWTLGECQKAWSLIPELSTEDVTKALQRAGKTLPADRVQAFRERLEAALQAYVAEKLLEASTAGAKRSATAMQLDRIAKHADRLLKLMPADSNAVTLAAGQELRRAFLQKTPWLRRTLLLPPTDPAGFAALRATSKVVATLAEAARRAYKRERDLIEREGTRKGKARRKGDTVMRTLMGTINGIWTDFFQELPEVSWNALRAKGGGSYLLFVHGLLHAYAARVPDELQRLYPGLRARLRPTQQAVRGHFRATGTSRLPRMA